MERIENARLTLKVLGILNIIFGVFAILAGIAMIAGGGLLGAEAASAGFSSGDEAVAAGAATTLVVVLGVVVLVQAIVYFLLGVFSVRAAGDFSKIGPAYIFSIIGLALSIIVLIFDIFCAPSFTNIAEGIVGIIFAACIYWAAKTIKEVA